MTTLFAHRPLDGTPYVLTGSLGEGGMGHVFAAEHVELKRRAAIKLLGTSVAYQARAMERLRREARALAQIDSPHIIDIYDMGFTADGQPYIAMSFVEGADLATLLERTGPFDPERVVRIAEQVAVGLTQVHAQGMVHRDLKPENIMIERRAGEDHVVILDFGIARVLDEDTQITRDGQVMGTPGYIAPEQALGHAVDGRADQYGLAAVLYELLTGESAYAGTSGLELMTAQLTRPPRPFEDTEARIPPHMQAVIMRALSRDWGDRYPDMASFAAALRASLTEPLMHPATRASRLPFYLAALIGGAAVAGLVWTSPSADPAAVSSDAPARSSASSAAKGAVASAPEMASPASVAPNSVAPETRAPSSVTAAPKSAAAQTDTPRTNAPPAPSTVAPESATPQTAPAPAPSSAHSAAAKAPAKPASVASAAPRSAAARRVKRSNPPKPAARRARPRSTPPPEPVARTPKPPAQAIASAPAQPKSAASAPPVAVVSAASTAPPTSPTSSAAAALTAVAPAPKAAQTAAPSSAAPPKAGRLVIGPAQIQGAVSDRPIRAALQRSYPQLRRCVRDAGAQPPGTRATIRLAIDGDGFLHQIQGEGAPALTRCGTQALRRIRRLRRRPDTGQIRVRLPLNMESL